MHWKLVTCGARAGAVVVLLGLAGCFTAYKAPETGPVAKVRIQIESDDYFVIVDAWKHGVCSTTERIGLVGASPRFVTATTAEAERSKLGMLGGTSAVAPKRLERVVPADRPFSLLLQALLGPAPAAYGLSSTTCNATITFTPLQGAEYEISHTVAGKDYCRVAVIELQAADGGVNRIPVRDFQLQQKSCL
jgi:hypothetical protein